MRSKLRVIADFGNCLDGFLVSLGLLSYRQTNNLIAAKSARIRGAPPSGATEMRMQRFAASYRPMKRRFVFGEGECFDAEWFLE